MMMMKLYLQSIHPFFVETKEKGEKPSLAQPHPILFVVSPILSFLFSFSLPFLSVHARFSTTQTNQIQRRKCAVQEWYSLALCVFP